MSGTTPWNFLSGSTPIPKQFKKQTNIKSASILQDQNEKFDFKINPTVIVELQTARGDWIKARYLLDSGAQSNIMSLHIADQLKNPIIPVDITAVGFNNKNIQIKRSTDVKLRSCFNKNYIFHDNFLIHPSVSHISRAVDLNLSKEELDKLKLSDEDIMKDRKVDILIGAKLFAEVKTARIQRISRHLVLEGTRFGNTLMGSIDGKRKFNSNSFRVMAIKENELPIIGKLLQKFFEYKALEEEKYLPFAEAHFRENFKRLTNSYEVRLPFKINAYLGESRIQAIKRVQSMYKKLTDEQLNEYNRQFQEMEREGVIREAPKDIKGKYFVPHFAVYKNDSLTTKCRIVFDCGMKTSNGKSLNCVLHAGNNINNSIAGNIVRFRLKRHCLSADIARMFLSIVLAEQDRCYQRFFIMNDKKELREMEFTTLLFGNTSSPFLACRVLKQIGLDYQEEFPLAAKHIQDSFFIGDFITSCFSIEEANQTAIQLRTMLAKSGLYLRKWSASDDKVLKGIPKEEWLESIEREVKGEDSNELITSILGMKYSREKDCLMFKVKDIQPMTTLTKRQTTSICAGIMTVQVSSQLAF
ncbi:hypothetical protein PVAND_014994 [Polypedilum vanderplanki]|uniref:Reverse transcriptase domain-containing protein n=1 Tax=Polypedilum vanderplanki TaxID=319348 RepID=A0A9J6BBD4_POLVA|nr:hypothetical protein PVAND_014994 [Polypedilum vanderplanki]